MRNGLLFLLCSLIAAICSAGSASAAQLPASSAGLQTITTTRSGVHEGSSRSFSLADALNEMLPGWLSLGGEYRARYEGPAGTGYSDTSDSYLLSRLRIYGNFEPEPWMTLHAEVQDARIFFNQRIPRANPYEDTWTLWEGYFQVGRSTRGPIDVLVGRQALTFGDERVIGPSNWLNVGRTFNVARFDYHQKGDRVSVFASSVLPGDNRKPHGELPGNNLYGIYATFLNTIPASTFEPYVLWRLAPARPALPETAGRGPLNEVTLGFHAKGALPATSDYDTEFDWQRGSLGASSIAAWAGYVAVGHTFENVLTTPRLFLEGNYASGTKTPNGRQWNTFDQLYPSNHDKLGLADVMGRRNLEQFRVGAEQQAARGLKLKEAFISYWLATSHDNLYASSGAIAVPAHPGVSRHVGNEFDVAARYAWINGLNLGFGYARLFAGEFLRAATSGHDYSYPYVYVDCEF